MLDIKFIKENPDLIKDAARKKHIDFDVEKLLEVEQKRVSTVREVDELRSLQNNASESIARMPEEEKRTVVEKMRLIKEELRKKEEILTETMTLWRNMMLRVPNIPDMSVPEGESDEDNQEVRRVGEKTTFNFKPKSHIELMESLDLADFSRGTKTAGFRGYYLKNDGVLLSFALWRMAYDMWSQKGFSTILAPSAVKKESFMGTGYLPQSEDDLYKTQDDLYLSGTAEVPTMGYYMDEILNKDDLPQKILAFSPCFRREIGSHGKDTKGLIRVHEFYKLEQIILCEADHEMSVNFHEEITKNSEELLQRLGLPYRVVINAGGDLGLGQVKKYDIEVWTPSEEKYRETHSSSYFHDFQSRRLNIKYKDSDGKTKFVHSLNNTAIATPRILAPLIENNQTEDGRVKLPAALVPYIGKEIL